MACIGVVVASTPRLAKKHASTSRLRRVQHGLYRAWPEVRMLLPEVSSHPEVLGRGDAVISKAPAIVIPARSSRAGQ